MAKRVEGYLKDFRKPDLFALPPKRDLEHHPFHMLSGKLMAGCTPDLPRLRFQGPQQVFLWDQMQNLEHWAKMRLAIPKDIMTTQFNARTQQEFVPALRASGSARFEAFLPMGDWRNQLEPYEAGALFSMGKAAIKGKVVSVGVKGMQAFDEYYVNGMIFDRIKLPISSPRHGGGEYVQSCWVYVNKLASIAKYDPHANNYKFGTYFDPVPFNKVAGEWVFPDKFGKDMAI